MVLVTASCTMLQARLLCPWNSPGNNTREGCHSLLQGIFLTQGLIPGLLHLQADGLLSESPGTPGALTDILKRSPRAAPGNPQAACCQRRPRHTLQPRSPGQARSGLGGGEWGWVEITPRRHQPPELPVNQKTKEKFRQRTVTW